MLRKNLFLIIKEAFHNIIKHSAASIATVHIAMNKSILSIDVADNGKGAEGNDHPTVIGSGNGIKNMKKRMDEIGGTIHFSSINGMSIHITVTVL